jgi:hypothetical protein
MWDGWKKLTDTEHNKSYELLVAVNVDKAKVMVSLMTVLAKTKSDPPAWKVEIFAFNPGAGDYPLYENVFSNIAEAEKQAWEQAQKIAQTYRRPKTLSNSTSHSQ